MCVHVYLMTNISIDKINDFTDANNKSVWSTWAFDRRVISLGMCFSVTSSFK